MNGGEIALASDSTCGPERDHTACNERQAAEPYPGDERIEVELDHRATIFFNMLNDPVEIAFESRVDRDFRRHLPLLPGRLIVFTTRCEVDNLLSVPLDGEHHPCRLPMIGR